MRAKRLRSSLIDRIVFDDEAETLSVCFRNSRRYVYQGVPRAVYDAFGKAASAGRFFNECVKGRFPGRPDPGVKRYRPAPDCRLTHCLAGTDRTRRLLGADDLRG